MQSKWIRRFGLAAITGTVAWTAVGCAQERSPVNRVQANALSKHFFVGADLESTQDDPEFYMRNTVIDVPYEAGQDGLFTASYGQPLTRVKWEISENALIARETFERIANSDYNGARTSDNGQVVAMFNIESQFDIKRDYNPQTGEENNVIVENTTDRPWYEREYFRVDWSKNLITDNYNLDTLSQIGIFGGVTFEAMTYFVDDPNSPDAPVFAPDEGYFDVTTKAFATPQTIQTPFGNFPACFLPAEYGGSGPVANCDATEVTLRLSFRQVVDKDYAPVNWDGNRQNAFGFFTEDRYGYTRNYGILDDDWHRFAARYNTFVHSHVQGADGSYAQCAIDVWRDSNGNPIKYQTDGQGNYITDPNTGLPIATSATDPNGQTFTKSGVGLDVHRDTNANGTEDECEFTDVNGNIVNAGSQCDEFTNRCTLPMYNRVVKTTPWYFAPGSAPDLFPSTAKALGEWNLAVKRAIQLGKIVEAKRVNVDTTQFTAGVDANGNAIDLSTEAGLIADNGATVTDVFVLCHSPTIETDAQVCHGASAKQITCSNSADTAAGSTCWSPQINARIGDLRYDSVNIITNPQTPSPWGIMVDANDPLTGEKVVTSVNEWGAVLDIASQGTEDLIRWINGEITDAQVTSGEYLRDWATASKLGTAQHQAPALTKKEIQSRLNSIDYSVQKLNGLTTQQTSTLPRTLYRAVAAQNLAQSAGPSLDNTFESNRQAMVGSKWEAMLASATMLQAANMDPTTPVAGNDTVLAAASPLRGQNPQLNSWVSHQLAQTMANNDSCMVDQPEPDSLVGLARQAATLYPLPDSSKSNYPALKNARDNALHQWIREQFHISVIAHEMGHSMGLRHNFTGSFDALNYHPQYWQLRTRNGAEHYCGEAKGSLDATTPHTNGTDCVGPRWVDPITDTEVNGLIWKWGSSTVMDYPGDQTQDMNDIGAYDKAAMRFGYADIVDVETDATVHVQANGSYSGTGKGSDYILALDGFGGIGGQSLGGYHYSEYNDKYNLLGKCTGGTASDPLTATCTGPTLDYVATRDMLTVDKYGVTVTQLRPDLVSNFAVDKKGRVRRPYMFGSDEFADFGNVPVFRFDSGADSYEQIDFLVSTYENRYIFDDFRRDRSTFDTQIQVNRAQSRYFDKIQGITKSFAFLLSLEGNPSAASDPGNLMPMALGASDGLAMWARILTRPEPGTYVLASQQALPFAQEGDALTGAISSPIFNIAVGSGEGRYLHNDYDYTQGYYWSDYQIQVGSAYEKINSIYYLTEAYDQFISNSKEDYIDGRYKNVNYSTIYPNQIRRLFSNTMQNDPMTLGSYVIASTTAQAVAPTVHVQYIPWEKYDPTDPTTTSLDYPDGAIVLDPLYGWEEQFRSLVAGFFFGPTTLTQSVVDQMRIYSPGGTDSVDLDPALQVQFIDPQSGITYIARNYGKEQVNSRIAPVATTTGARMVEYANTLAAQTYIVTSTDPQTGAMTYQRDADGNPVCQNASTCTAQAATLQGFSANLDVARQLTSWFGYGPLDQTGGLN